MLAGLERIVVGARLVWLAGAIALAIAFAWLVQGLIYLLLYLVAKVFVDDTDVKGGLVLGINYERTAVALLTFAMVAAVLMFGFRRGRGRLRDCPACLSPVPLAASVCGYCSSDIEPDGS